MKQPLKKKQKQFILFLCLLPPIYVAVTLLIQRVGPVVVDRSLPLTATVISRAYPETELVSLRATMINNRPHLAYRMKITKYLKGIDIPLIDYLDSTLYISSQLITAVIFYSLLIAWPFASVKKRLLMAVILTPFVLLFMIADTTVSTVGSIEIECQQKLRGYIIEETLARKLLLFATHFFNNGGRQFLGVLLFAVAAVPIRFAKKPKTPKLTEPCPCGSGKMFKNCCGKDLG